MAIVEGLMVWLLMMCGFSIDLPSDVFVIQEINTSMYESYEHTNCEVHEIEPVDPIKEYVAALNTSINRSERVDHWTCYDYSVDFVKNNPEWGVVTIGKTQNFCPKSHMVNYLMYETQPNDVYDDCMIVYDGLLDNLYYINGWQYDYDYYHFWVDGSQPARNYRFLVDNRDVVM